MISEPQFKRTKLSTVMSYDAYLILDKIVQQSQSKVPSHVRLATTKRWPSSKGANLLTTVCVFYLKQLGFHAERVNTQGQLRKIKGSYKWVHSGSRKGSADIHAVINGRFYALEIKIKDRQSEYQQQYEVDVTGAGGEYHIIRKFDDLLEILNKKQ